MFSIFSRSMFLDLVAMLAVAVLCLVCVLAPLLALVRVLLRLVFERRRRATDGRLRPRRLASDASISMCVVTVVAKPPMLDLRLIHF